MKRYLLLFGILFMCLGVNINAEYVDSETPAMEQYESEYIEDNTPKSRSTLTYGALTIPVELLNTSRTDLVYYDKYVKK